MKFSFPLPPTMPSVDEAIHKLVNQEYPGLSRFQFHLESKSIYGACIHRIIATGDKKEEIIQRYHRNVRKAEECMFLVQDMVDDLCHDLLREKQDKPFSQGLYKYLKENL